MKALEAPRPPAPRTSDGSSPGQVDDRRRGFWTGRRIRFSDLDRYGRVHNLSLIQYIEDAQVDFTCASHTGRDLLDVRWAAARRDVSFLRPLPMVAEPVDVFTTVSRLGRSTLMLASRIEHRGTVHARSQDRFLACGADGRRRRLDEDELCWLRQWVAEEGEA